MTEQYILGLHAVDALLRRNKRAVKQILVNKERQDKRIQDILKLAEERNIPLNLLSSKSMQARFADYQHQGVVAVAAPLPQYQEKDLPELLAHISSEPLILILDGVTDPHNLGACLRTADAANVDFVIIPKDKSAGLSPLVAKVACGAAESIPMVAVTNLVRTMELLKAENIWIYGAAGEADASLYQIDCKGPMAIVMGAEGKGLRRLTREHCDGLFSLPMLGTVDSLNVSVATGVSLYEVVRQRSQA